MPKLLIKIIAGTEELTHVHMDGLNGTPYLFLWNKEVRAYTYEPKDQAEIEDIFGAMSLKTFPWQFAPIMVEGDAKPDGPGKIPPFIGRDKYAKHSLEELVSLCNDCGFIPQRADDIDADRAQLDAYMIGRAWAAKHPSRPAKATTKPAAVSTPEPAEMPE